MNEIGKSILSTSIPVIAMLLIVGTYLYKDSSSFSDSNIYEGVGEDDESTLFSEVDVPMSCIYRGKIKLDAVSQNSLKRFQRVLNNN